MTNTSQTLTTLAEILRATATAEYAVPAFNILNHLTLKAVIMECEALRSPVIIQTSTATVQFYGVPGLAAMVMAEAASATIPVSLHLDHCTDPALARECVDNGWSSIMIDASKQEFSQNIAITRDLADYAHARGVSVEGELGAILGVEDDIVGRDDGDYMADVEQSEEFVQATGIDAFAPAVGTAHGPYKGEPKIDFDRFAAIKKKCGDIPLVVHGGTDLPTEFIHRFIALGAAKINISTAIKQAYMNAIGRFLGDNPLSPAPLKLDRCVIDAVRQTVKDHVLLFNSQHRA